MDTSPLLQLIDKIFRKRKREKSPETITEKLRRITSRALWFVLKIGYASVVVTILDLHKLFPAIPSQFSHDLTWFNSFTYSFWENFCLRFSVEWEKWLLGAALIWWFTQYKGAVLNEIDILQRCFVETKTPTNWDVVVGGRWIEAAPYAFLIVFFLLAATLNNIGWFMAICLILNLFDFNGNRLTMLNIRRYIYSRKYRPLGGDASPSEVASVWAIRRAAKKYWLVRPQLERILFVIVFNFLALALSLNPHLFGFSDLGPAYALAALVIITNEIVMICWRLSRDRVVRVARNKMKRK